MRVAVAGGVPVVICDVPDGKGGAWSPSGTIVFGPNMIFSGLAKVSANGGPVEPATLIDLERGENSHRWPVFLPDGVHFLYFVRASVDERRGVYVARIDQPASMPGVPLFGSESEATFIATSGRERGVLLSGRRWPVAGSAVRRGDTQSRRGSTHVARGRGRKHSVSSSDVECIGRSARHGRDADAPRRATWFRRTRRHDAPDVSSIGAELATAVAGRLAHGPAGGRCDTGKSRCLGRGPPGRQPHPRHDRHWFRPFSGVVSGWAPACLWIGRHDRAPVEHYRSRCDWHCTRAPMSGWRSVLRANRLVARRPTSHRQHARGSGRHAPRRVERVNRDRRIERGDSLRSVSSIRCADIT